jgi:hypothetical protein
LSFFTKEGFLLLNPGWLIADVLSMRVGRLYIIQKTRLLERQTVHWSKKNEEKGNQWENLHRKLMGMNTAAPEG